MDLFYMFLQGGLSGYYELRGRKTEQGSLPWTSPLVEYTLYVLCTGTWVLFTLRLTHMSLIKMARPELYLDYHRCNLPTAFKIPPWIHHSLLP